VSYWAAARASPPGQLPLHHSTADGVEKCVVGGQAIEKGVDAVTAQQPRQPHVEFPDGQE
jgi:hypothetical protein